MARMSREFSLVLLGSGILTAGYFLYPEENLEAKQNEEVQKQVAGNHHHRTHYHHGGFLWIHTGGFSRGSSAVSGGRPVAMGGNVSRGGFGSIGRASAGS